MSEKLYVEEFGQGTPLTLLHGYPLDHRLWADVVPTLQRSCHVILPDLRGHGQSPAPEGPYSMREMAEDVVALLDTLEIEQTYIAGHSMGGYVAIAMLRYFPERILGLALTASHAYADSAEKKQARLDSIKRIKAEGTAKVFSTMSDNLTYNKRIAERIQKIIADANAEGAAGILAAMAERPDSINLLADFQEPVWIITGTEDQIIPIDTSRKMAQEIKTPRFIEISGAGHVPMLDRPEETAEALLSLINS
jgi:pimeloyl-ACP methyl ester carboxylesterase